MRHAPPAAALAVALAVLAAPSPARAQGLADVLARTPADSLVRPLRSLEARGGGESGDAALALGQLHYARGEYRQAADAFGRAAARLEPARKPEARYWEGLSWLGARDATQALAALDVVTRADPGRRALAELGEAYAWELQKRPDRALEILMRLTTEGAGEAGPAALERMEALAASLHRDDLARHARERLLHDWPSSLEAARVRWSEATPATAEGPLSVQLGVFADPARARALVEAAHRAGFPAARVVERRDGAAAVHVVRLGDYPDAATARREGERAARALGVSFQVVAP